MIYGKGTIENNDSFNKSQNDYQKQHNNFMKSKNYETNQKLKYSIVKIFYFSSLHLFFLFSLGMNGYLYSISMNLTKIDIAEQQ